MYKRPARILFVSGAEIPSQLPCELLIELEQQLLQGRCMQLGEVALKMETIPWADLVIALDAAAYESIRHAVPGHPLRRWSIPDDDAEREAYIRDQLNSMAAGMRMMQRQDA